MAPGKVAVCTIEGTGAQYQNGMVVPGYIETGRTATHSKWAT